MEQDLVKRLAEIQDALLALPDDAFAERYELIQERYELRDRAASYADELDSGRSDAELLAELAARQKQLKALHKKKINLVSQAGGGSDAGEMGNLGGLDLNARMMKASGADKIVARIGRITGILEDRGVEVPQ